MVAAEKAAASTLKQEIPPLFSHVQKLTFGHCWWQPNYSQQGGAAARGRRPPLFSILMLPPAVFSLTQYMGMGMGMGPYGALPDFLFPFFGPMIEAKRRFSCSAAASMQYRRVLSCTKSLEFLKSKNLHKTLQIKPNRPQEVSAYS